MKRDEIIIQVVGNLLTLVLSISEITFRFFFFNTKGCIFNYVVKQLYVVFPELFPLHIVYILCL